MNVGRIFFFLFFMGTAGAFGCGMRGTVIKNAKGAMLPGAIVGTVLALFSGSSFLENNYYLLAGMGAAVMYFAGNMSCAQTVSLSEPDKEKSDRQRGIFGVWLKGTICCGLFASCVSVFISVLSGGYTLTEIILFIIFMPVSAVLFCFIFNRPFNPEKNKFPRIYLSAGDPEIWGGLLGVLLETVIFSCIVKDWGAVVMTASSMVFGGLSSLFALFLY
ncbi:MAG: hypothetical protein LUH40_02840, partial [Clostridiales bacterium]|nr:hypothetical protein [Clostridiales bacterium]